MIVAKAWTDPAFKADLLKNAGDAVQKLGIQSSNFAPKPKPAGVITAELHCSMSSLLPSRDVSQLTLLSSETSETVAMHAELVTL